MFPALRSGRRSTRLISRVAPPIIAAAVFALPTGCRDAAEPTAVQIPGGASLAKGGGGGGGGGAGGPKAGGRIVFESSRDGTNAFDFEIYAMS